MGTEQTVDGNTVTVHGPRAQTSVLHLTHPDEMGVTRAERGRYLFVRVRGTANGPAPTAFSLVVNGGRFRGTVNLDDVSRMGTILAGEMVPIYDPGYGTERGWVAFVVPAEIEAEAARIELDEGAAAWRVPDATLDRLRQPRPSWRLADVSLPAEVSRGDSFAATVAVENTGEVAGTFRAVLNVANLEFAYKPFPFKLDIDAGEKDSWSRLFSVAADLDADEIGLYLRTPVGNEEQQASVHG